MAEPAPVLYYDGGCNLCEASRTRAERWAERRGVPLRTQVLQSAEAMEKGYGDLMVLETPQRTYFAADAWLELIRRVGPAALRPVALFARTRPTLALARAVYNLVARYRTRIFGSRACAIPPRTRRDPGTGTSPP